MVAAAAVVAVALASLAAALCLGRLLAQPRVPQDDMQQVLLTAHAFVLATLSFRLHSFHVSLCLCVPVCMPPSPPHPHCLPVRPPARVLLSACAVQLAIDEQRRAHEQQMRALQSDLHTTVAQLQQKVQHTGVT